MKPIIAIDPGTTESAMLIFDGIEPTNKCILPNTDIVDFVQDIPRSGLAHHLVIEGIACFGMPVGKETFDTCIWIGRFIERWRHSGGLGTGPNHHLLYRPDIKMHLCHSMRAKDPHVRQALIDRFGPGKAKAIGLKAAQGPLYGIKSHLWSALAVAVTWWDLNNSQAP